MRASAERMSVYTPVSASDLDAWLTRYALMSPARAEQRTRFFDDYRSYVINYNLGKDLVRQYIESRGGTASASTLTAGTSAASPATRPPATA